MICSPCATIKTNREVFYTDAMNDFSVLLKMHLFLTVENGHTCNYIFMSILIRQLKIKKKKALWREGGIYQWKTRSQDDQPEFKQASPFHLLTPDFRIQDDCHGRHGGFITEQYIYMHLSVW